MAVALGREPNEEVERKAAASSYASFSQHGGYDGWCDCARVCCDHGAFLPNLGTTTRSFGEEERDLRTLSYLGDPPHGNADHRCCWRDGGRSSSACWRRGNVQ